MPELQQGCCIRNLFIKEVDLKEFPHSITIIDGFFHTLVGQVEPVLHKVHAEHNLYIDRFAAALIVVIVRANDLDPMTPGDDLIHRIKKFFTFGFTPAFGILNVTYCQLIHAAQLLFF